MDSLIAIGIIIGWIVALWIEKYYVSRATLLPSVLAVLALMIPNWNQTNTYFQWFILIGVLIGVIMFGFLISKRSIPSEIYSLVYPFYCGKTLMPFITTIIIFREFFPNELFMTSFWIVSIILLIIGWYIGIKFFNNNSPFKSFSS